MCLCHEIVHVRGYVSNVVDDKVMHTGRAIVHAGNHVLPSNWSGFRSEPMAGQRDLRQELPADRYALREDDQNVSHALPIARAEPSHARDATGEI